MVYSKQPAKRSWLERLKNQSFAWESQIDQLVDAYLEFKHRPSEFAPDSDDAMIFQAELVDLFGAQSLSFWCVYIYPGMPLLSSHRLRAELQEFPGCAVHQC